MDRLALAWLLLRMYIMARTAKARAWVRFRTTYQIYWLVK